MDEQQHTGRFILADPGDVVLGPGDVAKLISQRGWTLERAGQYLGCSGSHVGAFLRRNGYRPTASWTDRAADEREPTDGPGPGAAASD